MYIEVRHRLRVTGGQCPSARQARESGPIGTLLGDRGVNIANFKLGRREAGGEAICIVEVDGAPNGGLLAAIEKLPLVKQAKALSF